LDKDIVFLRDMKLLGGNSDLHISIIRDLKAAFSDLDQ